MKVLLTGAAGFIGAHIYSELAKRGDEVTGVDNINSYYDQRLKYGRLREIGFDPDEASWEMNIVGNSQYPNCRFIHMDIEDTEKMDALFARFGFDMVVNLAAQAGVRYSIANPYAYSLSNLQGFLNVLECCRQHGVKSLVFASSSSVYGMNNKVPFSEDDKVDTPVSLYAATKKSDELMAHCYSKLYGLKTVGLRYFTVYGPWGRPDMAPMLFARAISHGEEIKVYNGGDMIRDFTYIDDIVTGTLQVIDNVDKVAMSPNGVAYNIFNIGCSHPVKLMDFIDEIETALGTKAKIKYLPMQPGDVYETYADVSKLQASVGYQPRVLLHEGIGRFIAWYKSEKNPLR